VLALGSSRNLEIHNAGGVVVYRHILWFCDHTPESCRRRGRFSRGLLGMRAGRRSYPFGADVLQGGVVSYRHILWFSDHTWSSPPGCGQLPAHIVVL
jgi:hypothetical protein